MIPISVYDIVRLAAAEARSARPSSQVRPEPAARPAPARFVRVRLGLGVALRRLADRVEPCRPAVAAPAGGRQG